MDDGSELEGLHNYGRFTKVKLKIKAGRRVWDFEERLAEDRGNELVRKCWGR